VRLARISADEAATYRQTLMHEGLTEFRVTFGQAHRDLPELPEAHPDGWLTVFAPDETAARDLVFAELGRRWSNIYPVNTGAGVLAWDETRDNVLYPLGEVACWVTTTPTVVGS
jgi:hypothetical protein